MQDALLIVGRLIEITCFGISGGEGVEIGGTFTEPLLVRRQFLLHLPELDDGGLHERAAFLETAALHVAELLFVVQLGAQPASLLELLLHVGFVGLQARAPFRQLLLLTAGLFGGSMAPGARP